ncbi:PP2C family protein-serine/threonine phosphatase [Acinetobacter nosocomialis]|uniref:PP2C family protein-serine/threonine phosphatase n=1 Tax=Acinetobacter nosocomialis TaxID=106654 RepID=UPI0021C19BF1|nr:protein phosphatase 2C domain-containing protein [Acinetobacter nosocomialis]MCT9388689.1 protein phosphatase 2C domain-containing protein [Acinetobacter baumannii]MDQ9027978.1 protein phosphatase 2C domain-containing protein [Acinetobacter nosocomialis]MDQ9045254.1 protein phosphatase 2C domain-containing protein [Acinetobacter nosocomialis]MDQ9082675.1 protein phosphatase 2C domain-containing protein [Acinetobacter nosocomialis]
MYRFVECGSFSFPKPDKDVNEDFLLLPTYDLESNIIFAIADGVGSLNGANKASSLVIETISKIVKEEQSFSIEHALKKVKEEIDSLSSFEEKYSQAATTLTLVKINKEELIIGHVGDCRAYVKKHNKLLQLTKDHTRYQQLLDAGEISKRKLSNHKKELSSILIRAISARVDLQFDIVSLPINELIDNDGSIIISLMSDGAYNYWHKRPKFSDKTMSSPLSFVTSLRKRIEKEPNDDFTCLTVKLMK